MNDLSRVGNKISLEDCRRDQMIVIVWDDGDYSFIRTTMFRSEDGKWMHTSSGKFRLYRIKQIYELKSQI